MGSASAKGTIVAMADPLELARLHKFISGHREKFALALVRVPQLDVREELRVWAASVAGELGCELVVIDGTGQTVHQIWDQIAAGSRPGDVVVLTGLDELLRAENRDLATLLNRQRERIGQLLRGPVLWLIGDLALDRLLVVAPDLADWYAASFEFERSIEIPTSARTQQELEFENVASLSRSFLRQRIGILRQQLQGESLPAGKEAGIQLQLAKLYRDFLVSVPDGAPLDGNAMLQASLEAAARAEELLHHETSGAFRTGSELGSALQLQATALLELGRVSESLGKTAASVAIFRKLAAQNPTYQSRLTQALLSHAIRLNWVGQHADALQCETEALDQLRRHGPEPSLGVALSNHAATLLKLGRVRDALAAAEEALPKLRVSGLAVQRASLLVNYAAILAAGKLESALPASEEGLQVWRELASRLPDRHSPNLAYACELHTQLLTGLGRAGDARSFADEAVRLRSHGQQPVGGMVK